MKRIKLLPSVLMLVLCIGVLAMGIYAATPATNNITGTITVNASNSNVAITVYMDAINVSSNQLSERIESRNGKSILLNKNTDKLTFATENLEDDDPLPTKTMLIKIENLSSKKLGAYFKTGDVPATGATLVNILRSKNFNGTYIENEETKTVENLLTATLPEYTELPGGETITLECTLALNMLFEQQSTINLDLDLNIELYQQMPEENSIVFKTNDNDVSVSASLINACAENQAEILSSTTSTINTTEFWKLGNIEFNGITKLNENPTLPNLKIEPSITNNENYPISVNISSLINGYSLSNGCYSIVNNKYIDASSTGKASIQFAINYEGGTFPTDFTIEDFVFNVDITKASEQTLEEVDIANRINYLAPASGGLFYGYYIDFGNNPYYTEGSGEHREKLRWYIYAKDNGGEKVALDLSSDVVDGKLVSNKYYFISEYALDVSKEYGDIKDFNWRSANFVHDDCMCSYSSGLLTDINFGYATTPVTFIDNLDNLNSYFSGDIIKTNIYLKSYYAGHDGYDSYYDEYYYYAGKNISFYNEFSISNDALAQKITGLGQIESNDFYMIYEISDMKNKTIMQLSAPTTQCEGVLVSDSSSIEKGYFNSYWTNDSTDLFSGSDVDQSSGLLPVFALSF